MRMCASVARLMETKDVDEATANLIRQVWKAGVNDMLFVVLDKENSRFKFTQNWLTQCHSQPQPHEVRRAAIDELLGTHGVEYLGTSARSKNGVYYCNAGDTYATTIIFNGTRLSVGSMGDWVEAGKVKPHEGF